MTAASNEQHTLDRPAEGAAESVSDNAPAFEAEAAVSDRSLSGAAAINCADSRDEARRAECGHDGTLIDGAKVAEAWGVQLQMVDAARERGEIFSLWVKSEHWYPSEALGLERGVLAAISRALGDADPCRKLLFLLRKHGELGGQTPADAAAAGRCDEVVRLAAEWAGT